MDRAELQARLRAGADALRVPLTPRQEEQLLDYLALIDKWNRVYNLTAVRDPGAMLSQHVLDSLAVVPPLRRHGGGAALALLDVGAGAGLPGVVLAVCCPQIRVDCVDAVAKKSAFIQQVAAALKLGNLRGLHERVERLPGPYEIVTSRAFASLSDFVAWSAGALAPQGVWMAMKGRRPDAEIAELPPTVEVFHVEQLQVPGMEAERCLVWMRRLAG